MDKSEGSPTLEEQTPEPKRSASGRPPFKLCFTLARVKGRSDISPSHPRGFVHCVTGKFYSEREIRCENEPDMDLVNKAYNTGPRETYNEPLLESHRYGWYDHVRFTDISILRDKQLNFPKCTSEIFKIPTLVRK